MSFGEKSIRTARTPSRDVLETSLTRVVLKMSPRHPFGGKLARPARISEGCLGNVLNARRPLDGFCGRFLEVGDPPGALICRKFDRARILLPRALYFAYRSDATFVLLDLS